MSADGPIPDGETYHVVDCGAADCRVCPAAFRDEDEDTAIIQAKAHGARGQTAVAIITAGGA